MLTACYAGWRQATGTESRTGGGYLLQPGQEITVVGVHRVVDSPEREKRK